MSWLQYVGGVGFGDALLWGCAFVGFALGVRSFFARLSVLLQSGPALLSGEKTGTRQSAASASSEASLTGQGMGSMPMLTCVQPVPRVMVRDIRPAFVPACHGVCLAALGAEGAPLAGEESAQAAGAQALPDGNHGDNKKVAEPTPGVTA